MSFVLPACRGRATAVCAVIPLLFGLAGSASAATRTWTGAGPDTNASTATNWQGGVAPADGDDLVFPSGVAQTTVTQDLGVKFNSIAFATTGGAVYHVNGPITLVTEIHISSGEADLNGTLTLYQNGTNATNITLLADMGSELMIVGSIVGQPETTLHTDGLGRVTFAGSGSALTGPTQVDDGTLRLLAQDALGSGTAFINQGTLELGLANGIFNHALTFNDSTTLLASESATITAPIDLLQPGGGVTTINVAAGKTLTISGVLENDGAFIKQGAGDLTLAGTQDNTFGVDAGNVPTINAGTVHLNQHAGTVSHVAFPASAIINNGAQVIFQADDQIAIGILLYAGGQLRLNTFQETLARLDGNGGSIDLAGGTLNVADGQFAGAFTGTGVVNVVHGTELQLTGISTFTGTTNVISGETLTLNGTLPGPIVLQGGKLQGVGTAGAVSNLGAGENDGVVIPGSTGGGTLHTQAFSLTHGAYILNAFQTAGGPAWAQTKVTGSVTLGDGSATGTQLVTAFDPNIHTLPTMPIVIIDNDGTDPVVGTFTGRPEGSSFTINGLTYYISYHGGDGNDVVLTATPVQQTQTYDYYLSEGSTGGFFTTDVLIANPNNTDASATLTFYTQDIGVTTKTLTVPAMQRVTVTLNTLPEAGQGAVSTIVHSNNNLPLIVERTMSWDKSGYGASGDKAVSGPSTNWYFAEGSQGFFSTYVLLANPQTSANTAHVTYFCEGDVPLTRDYALAAQSRTTIDIGADAALVNRSFGMQVTFDAPGVAERSMYFGTSPFWSGGHESAGTPTLAYDWLLAEGATGPFFETFVLLANPTNADAQVTVTFLPQGATPVVKQKTVKANSRMTINIEGEDPALGNAAVATQIHSTQPLVAERSQYWPDPAPQWYEAHNSFGVAVPGKKWGLSEGRVGQARQYQTYILLANAGNTDANVTIQFLRENGGATVTKSFVVRATSRLNVAVGGAGSDVPELVDENFGAIVTSDQNIAVERSMYSNANGQVWAAGTNATASPLP